MCILVCTFWIAVCTFLKSYTKTYTPVCVPCVPFSCVLMCYFCVQLVSCVPLCVPFWLCVYLLCTFWCTFKILINVGITTFVYLVYLFYLNRNEKIKYILYNTHIYVYVYIYMNFSEKSYTSYTLHFATRFHCWYYHIFMCVPFLKKHTHKATQSYTKLHTYINDIIWIG